MLRRDFIQFAVAGGAALTCGAAVCPAAVSPRRRGLGYNTFGLRSLGLSDRQLLEWASSRRLDAVFLQATSDPGVDDPRHWGAMRAWCRELGLRLERGGGAILPTDPADFDAAIARLRRDIARAAALGSPLVRGTCGNFRTTLPGGVEASRALAVRVLRTVRADALAAGVKVALECHKEYQAWEYRELVEAAGPDAVGISLDTGNSPFVLEDPLLTLETLAPYVVSVQLRDTVIWEQANGIAMRWVPLGEGTVDLRAFCAAAERLLPPDVYFFSKPITDWPAYVLPARDPGYLRAHYPRARPAELERFFALAKRGKPYVGHALIAPEERERPLRRALPAEPLARDPAALGRQQAEHMEQSLRYARETLGLGRKSSV